MAGRTPYVSELDKPVRQVLKYRDDLFNYKSATTVRQQFLHWVEANPRGRFFAFLNFFDVHEPYVAPPEFDGTFSDSPPAYLPSKNRSTAQARLNRYDDCLAYLDHELGITFERLATLGILDDTVVIVTSDHGEQFGNHGLFYHGNSLYRDLLHVPLIVRYPREVRAGGRVSCAVDLQSLAATTVSLAGVQQGAPFSGTAMHGGWMAQHADPACDDGVAFSELIKWPWSSQEDAEKKSVATRDWHLIVGEDGELQLYRLDQDPDEHENLAETAEGKEPLRTLGAHLQQRISAEEWASYGRPFRI
jgi:arylsulfatase A-like enzyme